METPEQAARSRTDAIQILEDALKQELEGAQKRIWEKLLERLRELHKSSPAELAAILPPLLQEINNTVIIPLAAFYGQSLLHLPGLQLDYFAALGIADYQRLRAPLTGFLTARLGIDATGALVPGGYLSQVTGDTTVARQVLTFAYQAQASGVGLNGYKDGLNALVLGNGPGQPGALGLVQTLYKNAGDDFARNDRALQVIAGRELGLGAYLYQGGLVESSRPFCVARNGRVFLNTEIQRFGTSKDAYGGYSNKSEGLFAGKPEPYDPWVDCGGHNCRHHLHAVPNVTALQLRLDLAENGRGELYIK